MKDKINKNRFALAMGLFLGLIHALWAVFIALGSGILQSFLNWVFKIHFLKSIWTITSFNFTDAIWLIILTFVSGYVMGWVAAALWNWVAKK